MSGLTGLITINQISLRFAKDLEQTSYKKFFGVALSSSFNLLLSRHFISMAPNHVKGLCFGIPFLVVSFKEVALRT